MIVTRTLTAASTSNAVQVDHLIHPTAISIGVTFAGGGTASGVKVQFTLDALSGASDGTGAGLNWADHPTLQNLTQAQNAYGNLGYPVTGLRLVAAAIAGGETVTMTVVQAGK